MLEILPQSEGANIALRASGTISAADYETILPEFERRINETLQFRLLLDWEHLEGWEQEANPMRMAMRIMHRWRCGRLAIVSAEPSKSGDIEDLRTLLPRSTELQVFDPAEREAAWSWLTGDSY